MIGGKPSIHTYPRKIQFGDITIRDGFQHEEKIISTDAKVFYAEELILSGVKNLEVTNYANPKRIPQFKDADEVIARIRDSKKLEEEGIDWNGVTLTAVTIREKAVERAIEAKKAGCGPDRVLMMVSTDEQHHFVNSGCTLPEYWKEAERCIRKAKDAGLKFCGTVSTIWGSPISGPTDMKKALEFTKHWLDIGADDIEHADHDGSAPPNMVYDYFSMILDALPDTKLHLAHFHESRGWGTANIFASLIAGITMYEGTMGGIGGQPANFINDSPGYGTGDYYYTDPESVGLVSTEDMLVMMTEMGIETGIDIERILKLGRLMEKTIGRSLRSGSIHQGPVPKEPRIDLFKSELSKRKAALGEEPDQIFL